METTEKILKLAAENRQQAFRVIEQSTPVWNGTHGIKVMTETPGRLT